MTDVDSWDTCVLGYMCAQSILLAKDFPSPSPLNHPVEQAGREAVWRGSASQSSLVLRPREAHLVPLRSVHLSPTTSRSVFLRKDAESWSAVQDDDRSLCLTFFMFHTS